MKAAFINEVGGPDKLIVGEKEIPALSANGVLIRVYTSSINYIDTYHRSGLYKLPLPSILGRDGAGIVEKVGENVTYVKPGDRVAFICPGSYAEYVSVDFSKVVKLPDNLSFSEGVTCMLQGMTAQYLVRDSYHIKAGDTVLIHAGAGGTGSILIQLAKKLGARVITTVSSEAKAAIARGHGADVVINYTSPDWPEQVRAATEGGKGVHAVYDGVGKSTWEGSMQCCRKLATVVLFGNASGAVPPIDPLLLTKYGSIFLTRPTLFDHIETHEDFTSRAEEVFEWVASKALTLTVYAEMPLDEIRAAHELIESRAATGKIIIRVTEEKQA